MTFERTTDYAIIRAIITHPTQYRHAGDDFSPKVEDFRVNEDPRIWYILYRDLGKPGALLTFLPQNPICFEVHLCVLPFLWGKYHPTAILAAAFRWMFNNSPARRMVASIPIKNRLAIRLATRAGMARYGKNERSVMRGGRLQDQVLFGIDKETCQA